MHLSQNTAPSVEVLLEQGLELYGQNRVAEAVRCWHEVLSLAPDDRRALDYLDSAGVAPAAVVPAPTPRAEAERPTTAPPAIGVDDFGAAEVDREALVTLLRDKRYEEALEFLYRERERRPEDSALTRGIHAIKDHLASAYARELGSLDHAPRVIALDGMHRLSVEQRQVLRLVDGLATYGDILQSSRLGRFETYRLLAMLARDGRIAVRPSSVARMPAVRPLSLTPALPLEQSTPQPPTLRTPPVSGPGPRRDHPGSEPAPQMRLETSPPSSVAPPSIAPPSLATPRPPTAAPPDPYTRLFEDATKAYLRRDYDRAERLFAECVTQRPGDRRAEYNLRKLKERKVSP